MQKHNYDQWLAALRDGSYKQGQEALRVSQDEFCQGARLWAELNPLTM